MASNNGVSQHFVNQPSQHQTLSQTNIQDVQHQQQQEQQHQQQHVTNVQNAGIHGQHAQGQIFMPHPNEHVNGSIQCDTDYAQGSCNQFSSPINIHTMHTTQSTGFMNVKQQQINGYQTNGTIQYYSYNSVLINMITQMNK